MVLAKCSFVNCGNKTKATLLLHQQSSSSDTKPQLRCGDGTMEPDIEAAMAADEVRGAVTWEIYVWPRFVANWPELV